VALLAAAVAGPLAGCTAGQGEGHAVGALFITACTVVRKEVSDRGTPAQPELFDLKPGFFAGEPIQDVSQVARVNRIIIRLQPNGRRREVNDVLTFDIPNSREVARCVRGRIRTEGGVNVPDYDTANCLQGPLGPKLRIAPDGLVRASLSPAATCNNPVVASATSTPMPPAPGEWDSSITLVDFGSAASLEAPEMRAPIDDAFEVAVGERLRATAFSLKLEDDEVVKYLRMYPPGAALVPVPRIGGTMLGDFDFDLQRGRGAQTFP
jgi:hypothetical protein